MRLPFVAATVVPGRPGQQLLIGIGAAPESGDECGSLLTAEFHDGSAASANQEDSGFGDLVVEWVVFEAHWWTPSSVEPVNCRRGTYPEAMRAATSLGK